MSKGIGTGQNVGENTGWGSRIFLPPSGGKFPNGDIDWNNLNPSDLVISSPVSISGQSNITYEFLVIDGASISAFALSNCFNINIENCFITNITGLGNSGVENYRCGGITVRNCKMTEIEYKGVVHYPGENGENPPYGVHSDNLIESNWFERVGTCVTYQNCDGGLNNITRGNYAKNLLNAGGFSFGTVGNFQNTIYSSDIEMRITQNVMNCDGTDQTLFVEDWINNYRSRGAFTNNGIWIDHNKIKGGAYGATSGGGIMTSDIGIDLSTALTRNVLVEDNVLVDPGQYGIAITAGNSHTVRNNKVFASVNSDFIGLPEHQNVGIYVWRLGQLPGRLFDCEVSGNRVFWMQSDSNDGQPPYDDESEWFPNTGRYNSGGTTDSSPNHTTLENGASNDKPVGWDGNEWNYTDWNLDNGNAGYNDPDLAVPTQWEHFAPS